MTSRYFLFAAMLIGSTLDAAVLPLKPGNYVLASMPCRDPAFAGMFSYDGHQFSYPHATNCRSTLVSRLGRSYKVRETCSAAGDGSVTAPSVTTTTYTIQSDTRLLVADRTSGRPLAYRRCAAE